MNAPPRPRPQRRVLVAVLLIAATLIGIVTINAVWMNRQVLNEDNWTEASSALLESDAIRGQVAGFLVDQAFANVDVQDKVTSALPPRAAPLAAPITGAIRTGADRGVNRLLERPRVQGLWEEANRRAHRRLVQVLEGGTENVSTEGGDVVLDLRSILVNVTEQLGIGEEAVAKLPEDAGQITVLKSDDLELAQDALNVVKGLTLLFLILTFGLFGLAVLLSGKHRETLRAVGFAFIFIGFVALAERRIGGKMFVDALTDTESNAEAVEDVWTIATSLLVQAATAVMASGVVIVAAAWLAGPTHAASASRKRLAPYLASPSWAYGGLAAIVLLLAAWAPIPATANPISMLLIAALIALGTRGAPAPDRT